MSTILEKIHQAYRADHLSGSCLTAPLRAYNNRDLFQIADRNGWQKIALQVASFITAIFAYPIFGMIALLGISINLCSSSLSNNASIVAYRPEEGYSFMAQLNGVPEETEKFCEGLTKWLELEAKYPLSSKGSSWTMFVKCSSNSPSYDLRHKLIFDIQGQENEPELQTVFEIEDGEGTSVQIKKSDNAQARLNFFAAHAQSITDTIAKLSRKYNWIPESRTIATRHGQSVVVIPLPDYIKFPAGQLLLEN